MDESKIHVVHGEEESHEMSKPHPTHAAAEAGHLYKEDSQGRVLGRLLLPRPTNDPKDPLIWQAWRKHLALSSVCFFVFLSNWITVSLSPILVKVAIDLDVTITKASWLITFNLLFLGLGNLFWVPLSYKIGKRPVLVCSTLIFFVSSIWSSVAKDWGSLFGARILQGFGASCSEALGPAIVADLFFLHERGLYIGVYTFMIAVGSSLGGVFAGLVANANPNWRWVFWMNTIMTGVCFLATVLFQAETNFIRPEENETGEGMGLSELAAIRTRVKGNWVQSLGVTSWYDREVSIWWLWWRPWLTLQYPAVIWAILVYGASLGWVALQQTANAGVFPLLYNYSPLAVGNINLAYVVASCIGPIVGGPLSDLVVAMITKRHGGYFQPEFRLWCLIAPAVMAPIGLMMWGFGLENRLHPMVAIVGTGITWGVLLADSATAVTYVVDCYRPLAGETITILFAAKNTFAFGLSFAVFPWLNKDGYAKVSGYTLLIEGVFFLLTIPMYIYGERLRRWTTKFVI